MGNAHRTSDLDRARDELMSHVVRCQVLDAAMEHRFEWLDETMDYMADRWPSLGTLQMAQLEMMGRQYLRPVIEHGSGHTALNRPPGPTLAHPDGNAPGSEDAPPNGDAPRGGDTHAAVDGAETPGPAVRAA